MSHSNPDVAQEARITAKLTNVVKPGAIDEFITEHRDGQFDESTLDAWLTKRKEDRPHRFIGNGSIDPKLVEAARAGNITARGKCFVALGKDQAALDVLLAKPPGDDSKIGDDNPWGPKWCDANGLYTKAARDEQTRIILKLGTGAAERMARKAGVTVGARRRAA
jgi:hypothetical protein